MNREIMKFALLIHGRRFHSCSINHDVLILILVACAYVSFFPYYLEHKESETCYLTHSADTIGISTRPTFSQFSSLKIRRTTFLNYTK